MNRRTHVNHIRRIFLRSQDCEDAIKKRDKFRVLLNAHRLAWCSCQRGHSTCTTKFRNLVGFVKLGVCEPEPNALRGSVYAKPTALRLRRIRSKGRSICL